MRYILQHLGSIHALNRELIEKAAHKDGFDYHGGA